MGEGICKQVAVINDVVDARLIASAPEMYEALKILVSQYEDSGDFTMGGRLTNEGFLKGKAALKKAEGTK